MTGVYSVAEVVDDSNKRPLKTILLVLNTDEDNEFDKHQVKSLNAVKKMVADNGGFVATNMEDIASHICTHMDFVNAYKEESME